VVERYGNTSDQRMVGLVAKDSPIGNLAGISGKKLCIEPNSKAGYYGALETLLEAGVVAKNHCPYEYALSESFSSVEYAEDPLECLASGRGDVAFVPDSTLHKTNVDLQVLCTDGKKTLSESDQCKFSSIPPKMVNIHFLYFCFPFHL
jgi:ABC-type phosphate/phosphonate transport system substrate-binding protein